MDRLRGELQAYKERLGNVTERQKLTKGTHREVHPTTAMIDAAALDRAVQAGDYSAFLAASLPYEEEVRKSAGRWVQRYPDVEARIGPSIQIADIVEEVFLLAFEGYRKRPQKRWRG